MNSDRFEGKWKQFKGSLKYKWGKLTDDDVIALSGKKDELIGQWQECYGLTGEQTMKEANHWARTAYSNLHADLAPRMQRKLSHT